MHALCFVMTFVLRVLCSWFVGHPFTQPVISDILKLLRGPSVRGGEHSGVMAFTWALADCSPPCWLNAAPKTGQVNWTLEIIPARITRTHIYIPVRRCTIAPLRQPELSADGIRQQVGRT